MNQAGYRKTTSINVVGLPLAEVLEVLVSSGVVVSA
jgi:predicted house-cleaning NTP pyrophosphatase (Maf/HAM1 superfamily)